MIYQFSEMHTIDARPSAHRCLVENKLNMRDGRIHGRLKQEANENEAER